MRKKNEVVCSLLLISHQTDSLIVGLFSNVLDSHKTHLNFGLRQVTYFRSSCFSSFFSSSFFSLFLILQDQRIISKLTRVSLISTSLNCHGSFHKPLSYSVYEHSSTSAQLICPHILSYGLTTRNAQHCDGRSDEIQ